jgi:hypothetical protein
VGAWPLAGSEPTDLLTINGMEAVAVPDLYFRDLVFRLTPLTSGQTRTVSFEYLLSNFAETRRRRLIPFETETRYSFAYKSAAATRSLAFFIHLPEGTSSYRIESTLADEPSPFTESGRFVLGFSDDSFESKGDQAIAVTARTKNELALPVTGLVTAIAIALVQISIRGYTFSHAVVSVAVGVVGAIALRLGVPRPTPRRF